MKPNAELAYRVLDHIDADPKSWDQATWWCKSSGCFAGWAVKLSGDDPEIYVDSANWSTPTISHVAAQHLGFTDQDAMNDAAAAALGLDPLEEGDENEPEYVLFSALNDREDLGQIVTALFGPRPAVSA